MYVYACLRTCMGVCTCVGAGVGVGVCDNSFLTFEFDLNLHRR